MVFRIAATHHHLLVTCHARCSRRGEQLALRLQTAWRSRVRQLMSPAPGQTLGEGRLPTRLPCMASSTSSSSTRARARLLLMLQRCLMRTLHGSAGPATEQPLIHRDPPIRQRLLWDPASWGRRAQQEQQMQDTTLQSLVLLRWNVRGA